jgi:hypothetical protein
MQFWRDTTLPVRERSIQPRMAPGDLIQAEYIAGSGTDPDWGQPSQNLTVRNSRSEHETNRKLFR